MSNKPLLIKDAAKLLGIGSTTLYTLLKEQRILGAQTNLAHHNLIAAGYFRTEQRELQLPSGFKKPYWVTVVTETGLTFLATIVERHKAEIEAKTKAKETAA